MDLELGEDQRLIQDSVRKLAAAEVKPGAKERDVRAEIAHVLFPRLEALGLFELESLGMRTAVIALEELARQDASLAFLTALVNFERLELEGKSGDRAQLGLRSAVLEGVRPSRVETSVALGAIAVGLARASLEDALAYANERKQFGKTIGEFQAIQWMLADVATETDAARLLVYFAAETPGGAAAEKARVFACETAVRAGMKAIQIHGGIGFTRELPVERYLRDAKTLEIWSGGSDHLREVIARSVLVG